MQRPVLKENPAAGQPMLRALKGEATERVPFWLMRQAGRYLPEYRALRAKAGSFMNLCFNPEWAAEVTLQPLHRFDMDAAILFSDILVVPHALGQALTFEEGEGPRLAPFMGAAHYAGMTAFDKILAPIFETVRLVRRDLSPEKTLIGFAGSPWTVACYMIEGRGGDFTKARALAENKPDEFQALIDLLVEATSRYLIAQADAGVNAVQLFDSWAGLVPEKDFDRWVINPTRRIIDTVKTTHPSLPIIGFPRGAGGMYGRYAAKTGVDAVGVDQGVDIARVAYECPPEIAVQGNLDPEALLAGGDRLRTEAEKILRAMDGRAFVFNLGHGISKETPPENVALLTEIIRQHHRS